MKRFVRLIAVLGALAWSSSAPGWGQQAAPFKVGQLFDVHRVVLDGVQRTVALRVFKLEDLGGEQMVAAQIVVLEGSGAQARTVFEGPKVSKLDQEAFRFVQGPAGAERIDFLGDLDGDGSTELVSARMQSDVRPPTWRIYRWRGQGFEFVRDARLVGAADGTTYSWHKGNLSEVTGFPWMARLIRVVGKGQLEAEIVSYDARFTMRQGLAVLQARSEGGYRLARWIKPLKSLR